MTPAVAVNIAVVAPAATITEAGTDSKALLLDSETRVPPAGAACDIVTVQVDVAAVPTLAGAQDNVPGTTGAFNVKLAVWLTPE